MAITPVDVELIEALRQGEAGAADRFLAAYYDHIFSFGMMVCGHREDAEDITQESLLSALRAVRTLRSPGAFNVWLFRIVRHACLRQRSQSRHQEPENAAGSEPEVEAAAWPDQMLLQEETRRQVQAAIATLSAADRLVVLLRDFEGLTTEEAAQVMELPASAIKMRLHRARRKLRQVLEPLHAPEPGRIERSAH